MERNMDGWKARRKEGGMEGRREGRTDGKNNFFSVYESVEPKLKH